MSLVLSGTDGVKDNSGALVSGTAQLSTSGTSIDFTGIPSWVKRITVLFSGVSTNGSSNVMVQIGSGSVQSTSYTSSATNSVTGNLVQATTNTSGFLVAFTGSAAALINGTATLCLVSGNSWVFSSVGSRGDAAASFAAGGITTASGTLDRIRITTVNGTDTFDAGSINILYE